MAALPGGQRGIALVLVLWVVVLLGVIAGAMSMTQRTGVIMVSNQKLQREGRALVDAGLRFMMLQLDNRNKPPEQNPWPADGRLHPWRFEDHEIWIGAMPEVGRIDLNQADARLLLGALEAAGLDEVQATAVRDAILDWRDADDGRHPEGAEDPDYLEEGRPIGARDGRFLSVEELQQVKGVTAGLYERLAPLLTVDAGQRTVNPAFASREVLSAIPDFDGEVIDEYLLERKEALDAGSPVPRPGRGGGFLNAATGAVYRLFAEVEMPGKIKVEGEMVINIQSKTARGYRLLHREWGGPGALGRAPRKEAED